VPDIAGELHEYLLALATEKRRMPDDALFSALVSAAARGEMTRDELTALTFLLLVAGHETTVNLIGNGVLALVRDRAQWRRLCADGRFAATAVEELLRYASPLEVATARFATADIEIGDSCIRAGETVFVGLGAANRDERCFEDAGRLNIERRNAGDHVAFGHGAHYCLGAALARLEGEIALTHLTGRFPDLDLAVPADQLRWKPGLTMRGLERLPVRLRPPRRAA
jgi:cytochrome P450